LVSVREPHPAPEQGTRLYRVKLVTVPVAPSVKDNRFTRFEVPVTVASIRQFDSKPANEISKA
jgi:hypothetical protein